jgi:hypothetical protein
MWKVGDMLRHRFDPDAGPGRVTALEGRSVVVHFPASDATLRFAAASDALAPYEMPPGTTARLLPVGEVVRIGKREGEGYRLEDGRAGVDRRALARGRGGRAGRASGAGEVDPLEAFANRLDALHLKELREAGGLGSYLGGRIRLFPHQLYVAERATQAEPVRWCSRTSGSRQDGRGVPHRQPSRPHRASLAHPHRRAVRPHRAVARRAVPQVPPGLRAARRQAPRGRQRELGAGSNPFEAHARSIIALEDLVAEPSLTRLAVAAGH